MFRRGTVARRTCDNHVFGSGIGNRLCKFIRVHDVQTGGNHICVIFVHGVRNSLCDKLTGSGIVFPWRHFQRNNLHFAEQSCNTGFIVRNGGKNACNRCTVSVIVNQSVTGHCRAVVIVIAFQHAGIVNICVTGGQTAVNDCNNNSRAIKIIFFKGFRGNVLIIDVLKFVVSVVVGKVSGRLRTGFLHIGVAVRTGEKSNTVFLRRCLKCRKIFQFSNGIGAEFRVSVSGCLHSGLFIFR